MALALPAVLLAWTLLNVPQLGWAATQVAFRFTDQRITTSAGLARDRPGSVYWTANRSADPGRVFAVSDAGRTVGTLEYRAAPIDVEALAYGDGQLFIGDIGDADASRSMITVYRLTQPTPSGLTTTYNSWDFRYPDGAHDAKAMVLDGSGRLYILTHEADAGIYAAPERPSSSGVNKLVRVGDAPAWVTDATITSAGTWVLRTYVSVLVLDPGSGYQVVASAPTPWQRRGESLVQPLAGDGVLVGSVAKGSRVLLVDTPTSKQEVPAAGSEPPTRAASSPASTSTAPASTDDGIDDVGPTDTSRSRGTLVAVGLAALVAVGAGLTVGLRRRG